MSIEKRVRNLENYTEPQGVRVNFYMNPSDEERVKIAEEAEPDDVFFVIGKGYVTKEDFMKKELNGPNNQ